MFAEDDFLPVSALQHLVFCPRQCALIFLERQWEENVLTTRGRIEHERVDSKYREFRQGRKQISGLYIRSEQLKLQGRLDILELDMIDPKGPNNLPSFHLKGSWKVRPVEFKHGEPKENDCDRIQLCAQVLCLEEMLNVHIEEASLFYWRIRRREEVPITDMLREKTHDASKKLHDLFQSGRTPLPVYGKRCRSCSLFEICLPKKIEHPGQYQKTLFTPQEA